MGTGSSQDVSHGLVMMMMMTMYPGCSLGGVILNYLNFKIFVCTRLHTCRLVGGMT